MKAKFFIWLSILLFCFGYSSQQLLKYSIQPEIVRNEFNRRSNTSALAMNKNDLLCECNLKGCDNEIIDIIGANFSGICRPNKGGVCRKVVVSDKTGAAKEVTLSCINFEKLIPPGRPFICQSDFSAHITVQCCSNVSFCNHFDQLTIVADLPSNLHWYFLLLLVVAIIFSGVGLLVGIFWCSSNQAKEIIQELLGRRAAKKGLKHIKRSILQEDDKNVQLTGLLDDLDKTVQSSGSGAGVLSLTERRIGKQITLCHIIGQGRFGEVFMGEYRGDKVAVKIFVSREEESWKRETEIYRTNMLRHSNVLRWISSDNKDTGVGIQFWLITEHCAFGSLYEYLGNYEINQVLAVQFIRSCVLGITYLHTEITGINYNGTSTKPGIAHRDIKSRNILVRSDLTCVIADLGLAVRSLHGDLDLPASYRGGTMRYSAPEFLSSSYAEDCFDSYTRMDVYALALVMWETCQRVSSSDGPGCFESHPREVPYFEYVQREPSLEDMHKCVCVNQYRPTIQHDWQTSPVMRELVRIMCECWSADPNARLPALNIRFALDKLIVNQNLKVIPN